MHQAKDYFRVQSGAALHGTLRVPGDKSISHRAVMFGALAEGATRVRDWLPAGDTEASLGAVRAMGVQVDRLSPTDLVVHGGSLHAPSSPLNLVNAGTGIRLLAGMLVGQPFSSVLDGSEQLRRRPMNRVIAPLRMMGADIAGNDGRAPLTITPAKLRGIEYRMPMASAQVKSAVLLAGLFAEGPTTVTQPGPARDHTERMLVAMGAQLEVTPERATITPGSTLHAIDFEVPGDLSSAAFLIVAALILTDSDITIHNVSLNPTRTGILDVLREMGGDISVEETGLQAGDPVGTIRARSSTLRGVRIGGDVVVRMIDEFPIFMVAALAAEGETFVKGAGELRVKETDRLAVMTGELAPLGAHITETDDGFYLFGPQALRGAEVDGHDDHRISMSLVVAGLCAQGETMVNDARCAADSFPGFAEALQELGAEVTIHERHH
ncbi:MAG TPA: 3-phosphoshikimate 1-carboxyvinyltransferase [Candidatus Limnocylindrales bacterium]|nr:3-phosphoshikimate 1-carboxyvinyltransferase [Candidatus Limnocylindrales bacterium]